MEPEQRSRYHLTREIAPRRSLCFNYGFGDTHHKPVTSDPMTKPHVAYYRVSTQRQGESGLGVEAQEAAVLQHVNGHGVLLAGYREIESGRKKNRPELAKAIAHAKRSKATLVIAKLDRLARNVAFVSTLMEAGIEFVCCDNPTANPLTIHILAAVAEAEAKAISQRTKDALRAYRERGGVLGAHHPGLQGDGGGDATEGTGSGLSCQPGEGERGL